MAGRLAEDARAVLDAAALGIGRAVVDAPDAREGDRLGAHRAGLERDVEIALDQPRRAELRGRGADRQQLGMGRRVAISLRAIAGFGQHRAVGADDHRADRHLAPLCGCARLLQCAFHRREPCRAGHNGENSRETPSEE